MRKIDPSIENLPDLIRIKDTLAENGYDATVMECDELWRKYSRSMSASFLFVPRDKVVIWHLISGML